MFYKDFFFFFVFQLLVVYPLGKLVLDYLGIKVWFVPSLVFSVSIGIVVLTLSALGLGYTNNYHLLPLLVIVSLVLFVLQAVKIRLRRINLGLIVSKADFLVILVVLICVFIQSIIVFPNGIKIDGSLRVKNVFTEDGMWHVAIINNLKKSIPPENPIFAGEKLVNYNYFSDIYISVIQNITNIETLILYFKLIGPFLAFLCASSLYLILKDLTKDKIISSLGVLIVTLASTYYYIFYLFKPGLDISPSTFFGNDYVSRMVNYQLSFSYLIVSTFLYLLLHKKNSLKFILITSLLISSGIGFKSYGIILIIAALYVAGFYNIIRGQFELIKIALFSSIFTAVIVRIVLQNSNATEAIFTFNPFWIIENMMTDPLRLNSGEWLAKRNHYLAGSNYLGISYLYIKGLVIFLFTQLGSKILGFMALMQLKNAKEKGIALLLSVVAISGIIASILFTQGGVRWNTIQFTWYSSFSLGILLVLWISSFITKLGRKLVVVIMILVWASFLPGVYQYSKFYLSDDNNLTTFNFKGTQASYQAASFLSEQPDGILLLDSKYSQTPFIIAISKKDAYFADESILSNLLIAWKDRSQKVEKFFSRSSVEYKKSFLKEAKIAYIFTTKDYLKSADYLQLIYNNDEVSIYKPI